MSLNPEYRTSFSGPSNGVYDLPEQHGPTVTSAWGDQYSTGPVQAPRAERQMPVDNPYADPDGVGDAVYASLDV